ncbi:hypothetical protein [Mesorhizobium loti]|uniref:hypothetical protein n=1 Tax=Rhizobium loti TaxID=381 RepID=UPI000415526B|nr:hypothetical protein [Mesorhizobium loti]
MCFCFDGDNAVMAFRPEHCRERLRGASAERLMVSQGEPSLFGAVGSFEPADAGRARHIAIGMGPEY